MSALSAVIGAAWIYGFKVTSGVSRTKGDKAGHLAKDGHTVLMSDSDYFPKEGLSESHDSGLRKEAV